MSGLEGKVALVTGGASGIGRATAERFAAEGMRVCIVDRTQDAGSEVADSVGGTFIVADAGEPSEVDAAFAHCIDTLGGLDVAFLNAGIAIGHADLTEIDDDLYRTIMRVNVDGVVYGARAAIRHMVPQGSGAIVATSSLAGLIPFPPDPIYDLTKHAVVGLIRSLAPTLVEHSVTANCVNPGMTDTNILAPEVKQVFDQVGFPLMPASQIAEAVVHAATCGETGRCWVCQPGREPTAYDFRNVPGPRGDGTQGATPPGLADRSGIWDNR
jgi:NAD(P)-dependent dehydrogenase (short-subunit alcohol dehydrogenase family)